MTDPVVHPFSLERARINRGLSQRALANAADVGTETIRRLERGLGVRPANAKKVADVFGVQVTDLMSIEHEARAAS
jgi:DNA-binding XRE family transcriptional regulator